MLRTTIAVKIGSTECSIFVDSGADISIVRFDLVSDDQYLPGTVKVTDVN